MSEAAGATEMADLKARADAFKDKGNAHLKEKRYELAIEEYTAAIETYADTAYFSNRALAYLRTEAYGFAKEDADMCIKLNPNFIKGYYRRASANMALLKFKPAAADLRTVVKFAPTDKDAKRKLKECEKICKEEAFAKAIECDDTQKSVLDGLDIDGQIVSDDYTGPRLEGEMTAEFVRDLRAHFKAEKMLHKKYVYKILSLAKAHLMTQPSLVDISIPETKFTICGDIHGQFYDLENIFTINGEPSPSNPYLFNGDFVDRGSFSLEVVLTMLAYLVLYPKAFYMARGNHETLNMNKMYGFDGEVVSKLNEKIRLLFHETFNWLPLAHVIEGKVFCTHGGLFEQDNVTLDDIRNTQRNREPPSEGIMCDLLWADPQPLPGRGPSKRGVGVHFGPDVTRAFLKLNNLSYMVRSHEVKQNGYVEEHDGLCITVFSAPNYCDSVGNKGAFITIQKDDLTPKFTSFDAVWHPNVRPMKYANNMMRM